MKKINSDGAFSQSIKFPSIFHFVDLKMTVKHENVIAEITEIFERMHARLDHRFQQLIRQINSHTNSSYKQSKFNDKIKDNFVFILENNICIFSPNNQKQLEENIKNFGRLTVSINFNSGMRSCESMCMLLAFNHSFLSSSFLC